MKHPLPGIAVAIALAAATTGAQAAGTVAVTFVNPEKYSDIGHLKADRDHALDVLRRHFEELGARLPDGQALKVEVLDVDLAGDLQLTPRLGTGETRVLKGRTDWPRMTLTYTLSAGGRTLKSGRDMLADMTYLQSRAEMPTATSQALHYETRMVDGWFEQNFVPDRPRKP